MLTLHLSILYLVQYMYVLWIQRLLLGVAIPAEFKFLLSSLHRPY
jgi:hypothetical protein